MTSANKGKSGSELREVEPIQEEFRDDFEDDDDIQRTPEVINLNEVKANNDEIKEQIIRNRESLVKEEEEAAQGKADQVKFDQFDVSSKGGLKELLRFQMRIFDTNYNFETD
jgi:hypothetical protein